MITRTMRLATVVLALLSTLFAAGAAPPPEPPDLTALTPCRATMPLSAGGEICSDPDQVRTGKQATLESLASLPIAFVRNEGQVADEALAYAAAKGFRLWLTRQSLVFELASSGARRGDVVALRLLDANPGAAVEMLARRPGTVSYLVGGDASRWRRGLATWGEVVYREVYPGIDLRVAGKRERIEFDFVVRPGGDVGRIAFVREGAGGTTSITAAGDLEVATAAGTLALGRPTIYQVLDGARVTVPGGFVQDAQGRYSFRVADYRKDRELVIDPVVDLKYSTYLGGSGSDAANAVAIDASGAIYVAGATTSSDFPLGQPHAGAYAAGLDVVVSKLAADGLSVVYTAYVGGGSAPLCGSPDDVPRGITVNAAGEASVAGSTTSADFPVVNGYAGYVEVNACNTDAFVFTLSADGQDVLYASAIGGAGNDGATGGSDVANDIAVDDAGFVYIAGSTDAHNFNPTFENSVFPTTPGAYHSCEGRTIFIAKFDPTKSGDESLVFSTCVGATPRNRPQAARALAVDGAGNIYIAGAVQHPDFPTTPNAYDRWCGEWSDTVHSFLSKYSPGVGELLYSTCLGGHYDGAYGEWGNSQANDLVVRDGVAYVVGAASGAFPLKHAFLSEMNDLAGYLSIVDTNLAGEASLVASTYVGSRSACCGFSDTAAGVALDTLGNALVVGTTNSTALSRTGESFQPTYGGGAHDCFLASVGFDGRWLSYRSYLGGGGDDGCSAVAADPEGNAVVSGWTDSSNFPTEQPVQPSIGSAGVSDAFISRISFAAPPRSLMVNISGPRTISPGARVTFVIDYLNNLPEAAQDAVVQVSLPGVADYVAASAGGIYRWEGHEVFWKLGALAEGAGGSLTITVEYLWGLPAHQLNQISAGIDAANSPVHVVEGLEAYLVFSPVTITADRELAPAEIAAFVAADPQVAALYQRALGLGFHDYGQARQRTLSDGLTSTSLYLLNVDTFQHATVAAAGGPPLLRIIDPGAQSVSIHTGGGGVTYHVLTGTMDSWGDLSRESVLNPFAAAFDPAADCAIDFRTCLWNCLLKEGLNWVWGKLVPALDKFGLAQACAGCLAYKDAGACTDCLGAISLDKASAYKDAAGEDASLPGVSEIFTLMKCIDACRKDPNSYACKEDRRSCPSSYSFYQEFWKSLHYEFRMVEKCNLTTCMYEAPEYTSCPVCDKCKAGTCVTPPDKENSCFKHEVVIAGDPNAKYGPRGDVVPGQSLDYTIEFENLGLGTAYGVFVVDRIDANLDEASLVVNNGGVFRVASRTITWDVGTLDPNGAGTYKGAVAYSIKVRDDVTSGTEIINRATVYFPSVPEITPTNPVVNSVYDRVAHPQGLTVESGAALPVTLAGLDKGGAPLAISVVEGPLFGTLSGAPPDVTYTSQAGFSGRDSFSFVVTDGVNPSRPALVAITVTPFLTETTPPAVVSTNPVHGATGVPVSLSPISVGAYPPVIAARFSEPLDPATVTADSFQVDHGTSGAVSYDPGTWTAHFTPAAPLAHGTTFTATLTTAVKDLVGNALAQSHSWQFATNSAMDLTVFLPVPGDASLGFGTVAVRQVSPARVVTLASTGTADLAIGTLAIAGADRRHYRLAVDGCSGGTLVPGTTCTVGVVFQPTSTGVKSKARLSIPSNDGGGSPALVSLRGSAVNLPDLTVNWLKRPSVETPVPVRVKNAGTAGSGKCSVRFFLSSDGVTRGPVLRTIAVPQLKAGSAAVLTFVYPRKGPISGTHVIAVVDPGDRVKEGNEANNAAAKTLKK